MSRTRLTSHLTLLAVAVTSNASAQCPNWVTLPGALDSFDMPLDAIVFDDGSGPRPWIAYGSQSVGVLSYGGVKRSNGVSWDDTLPGTSNGTSSFVVYDAGAGPRLHAGGNFGVQRLENGVWTHAGLNYLHTLDLAVFDAGAGPSLYAAGRGGTQAGECIVRSTGGGWVVAGYGFAYQAEVFDLEVVDTGTGPTLYASGRYLGGSVLPFRMGASGVWTPLPDPQLGSITATIFAIERYDDGSGEKLAAVISLPGYTATLALFDGTSWTTVPGTIAGTSATPVIYDIEAHDEDGDGRDELFIGGNFDSVAGVPIEDLARWNGTSWSALAPGVSSFQGVRMLASIPGTTGASPRLFVGGGFEQIGSSNSYRIAEWVGCPIAGLVECAGDGSASACPCANTGATNAGCANSLGQSGSLRAVGLASVQGDSLRLIGTGMPNGPALYFQGTSTAGAGAGVAFGDGLRCASGTVVRIAIRANVNGASEYPSSGDPSVSVRGLVPPTGAVRHYQVWYRNAASFCTSATFNFTNGLSVAWSA